MKYFLALSIFCLIGVNSFLMKQGAGVELEDDDKKVMEQCARELNFNASKYTHTIDLSEYAENPDEETTCMMACSFRFLISENKLAQGLTGSNNRETLYNGFMMVIDEAYKKPIDEVPETNRGDIVNKVEQCYTNEPTECGFFKCVEFYKPPYLYAVVQYLVHSFLNGRIESETGSTIH